jgi:multidrug resistance efflux pump
VTAPPRSEPAIGPPSSTRDRTFARALVVAVVVGATLALIAWWLAGVCVPSVGGTRATESPARG